MAWKLGNEPLADPADLLRFCQGALFPIEPWYRKANIFRIPTGMSTPGTGAVLMRRFDYNLLDTSRTMDLEIDSGRGIIKLQKISVVASENALPGPTNDSKTTLIVRLADRRSEHRENVNAAYNVRNDDATGWENGTISGGVTPYTWAQIFAALWAACPSAGSAPALPFTPHGTPENFVYRQVRAAVAIDDFLNRIGCAVVYRPDTDAYSVVRLGSTGDWQTAVTNLENYKAWQSEAIDPDRITYPATIRVLFRKARSAVTTPAVDPYYANDVTVSPAAAGVVAGSILTLHDDLTGTAANSATRTARAAERAADWLRIAAVHDAPYLLTYAGFNSDGFRFLGVAGREIAFVDIGAGEMTEARSGAFPAWTRPIGEVGGASAGSWETICVVTDVVPSCVAGTITLTVTKICRDFNTRTATAPMFAFNDPANTQLFPLL